MPLSQSLELSTAQQVKVKVKYRLTTLGVAVDDESITRFRKIAFGGNGFGTQYQFAHNVTVCVG